MGDYSWVTLATNDTYSLGALVLAQSLKRVGTKYQLVVMVTPGVTGPMREKLATAFNLIFEVNILDSKDERNLMLLQRPELGITFTKLHCWRLTQFKKCVFLDADTLVLQNCDELFEREEFSAAPDVGWPDCFNSGVFVYAPSDTTFNSLLNFALEKGSFDGGDQGLLNLYFSDWAHKDISKHLPFIYNMCSTAGYSYLPAFKQYGDQVKIIHFIGNSKPWLQYFNSESLQVTPNAGFNHLQVIFDLWWKLFCENVHRNLAPSMGGLAGAFAQLTLGQPRSESQGALEDHLRRQGWEAGRIDYLGQDSFDNVWKKICETLSQAPPKEPSPPKQIVSKPAKEPSPPKEAAPSAKQPSPPKEAVAPTKEPSPPKQVAASEPTLAAVPEATPIAPVPEAPTQAPAPVPTEVPQVPAPAEVPQAPVSSETPQATSPVETSQVPVSEVSQAAVPVEATQPVAPVPVEAAQPVAPASVEAAQSVAPAPIEAVQPTAAAAAPAEAAQPIAPAPVEAAQPAAPAPVEAAQPAASAPVEAAQPAAPVPIEATQPVAPAPVEAVQPTAAAPTEAAQPVAPAPVEVSQPAAPVEASQAPAPTPAEPAVCPITEATPESCPAPVPSEIAPVSVPEVPKETKAEEPPKEAAPEQTKPESEEAQAAAPPTITETPATPQTPDAGKGDLKPSEGQTSTPVPPPRKGAKNGGGPTKKQGKKK